MKVRASKVGKFGMRPLEENVDSELDNENLNLTLRETGKMPKQFSKSNGANVGGSKQSGGGHLRGGVI